MILSVSWLGESQEEFGEGVRREGLWFSRQRDVPLELQGKFKHVPSTPVKTFLKQTGAIMRHSVSHQRFVAAGVDRIPSFVIFGKKVKPPLSGGFIFKIFFVRGKNRVFNIV